ncbi:extracellular solute-binding protein [Paenibacillus sp. GD4]|uniref:extracellular solute-binding protein n=1 Tax=Paenibacillus sp. GD4 TaxID=3068890 RepID=UPI0027967806|nr:extracellular solute-binding protein [Paenibacillus sp. GD4]MDQ1914809.1 extracellular solute-binding protein [Paenibacillus sp. GD4]
MIRTKSSKTLLSLTALGVMGTALLSGCSSAGTEAPGAKRPEAGGNAKPTDISIMVINYGTQFADKDNFMWKEIEKRTNTKLNVTWVSPNNIIEKTNVTLASGDIPDLLYMEDLNQAQFRSAVSQGAFWDLTPFLKDYANFKNVPAYAWENTKINGKNYVIPRPYPIVGGGLFPLIRKDWLDKLNLKMPETVDDFKSVLKAFVGNDPDGNGQKDTTGYAATLGSLSFFYNLYNDTNGDWKLKDGKLVPIMTEEASREALLYIKGLYEDGLISPDFSVLKLSNINEALNSGKAGAAGYSMNNGWRFTEELRKTKPDAAIVPLSYLKGPKGNKFTIATAGYYGAFGIPKKVPEEKVRKILAFMDYGYSPEGNNLANYGIKDVHYTEADGQKKTTERFNQDLLNGNFQGVWIQNNIDLVTVSPGIPKEFYELNKKIYAEREQAAPKDPSIGLFSEAQTKLMPDLKKKVDDMRVKVILGQEKIEAYDAFITALKNDANLVKITKEMNDALAQKNK